MIDKDEGTKVDTRIGGESKTGALRRMEISRGRTKLESSPIIAQAREVGASIVGAGGARAVVCSRRKEMCKDAEGSFRSVVEKKNSTMHTPSYDICCENKNPPSLYPLPI